MHWAWHSHTRICLTLSRPGSHLLSLFPLSCPGTVTPGTAVLHVFLVAHGGESGHTLWLTLLTGHTFHLLHHCWTTSPDASPHLSQRDILISFIHFENYISCWYDVKPTLYLQHLTPCFSYHYLPSTMKLIVSRNLIVSDFCFLSGLWYRMSSERTILK